MNYARYISLHLLILIADKQYPTLQAVDYFLALPNNNELVKYKIHPQEWQVMQDVELILSVSK